MQPDSTIQWHAYPALLLAGCLAFGIASAALLPGLSFWSWTGMGVSGYVFAVVSRRRTRRRLITAAPLAGTVSAALVVVALGGARGTYEESLPADHVARRVRQEEGGRVVLSGRVLEAPTGRRFGIRLLVAADTLAGPHGTLETTGRVQVTLARSPWKPAGPFPNLGSGDVVRLRGILRSPPRRRNPAAFDYGRYLERHGVYATLTVRAAADVLVLGHRRTGVERFVATARAYVRRQFDLWVPSASARTVLHALVLGDRTDLDPAARRRFARTGLTHVLAVSGLHVLLVGMVLYGLLRPLLLRLGAGWHTMEITRAACTVGLLLAYVLLAGAGASAVRAVVMATLFIGGAVFQRTAHPLNTLGLAALVLLWARPNHLFEAGFQLSFAAVTAIVSLHPRLQARLPEAWTGRPVMRGAVGLTTVSVAATMGTAPVLLYHFGQVSFAGLVLNLAAIPLTALTLGAGLLTLLLGGWFAFGAAVFGAAADVLARGLLQTAAVGDAILGWAAVRTYVRDPWCLLAVAAGLVMLAQWPRPRLRWRLAAVTLGVAAAGAWAGALNGRAAADLGVVFFDVGHGDAALITLPGGRHVLVDAGERDAFSDEGMRTILPHLERFGIRGLDAVVISHPHGDHLGGVPALLRAVPVGRLLHNGQPYPSKLYAETLHLLDSLGVPQRAIHAGDTLMFEEAVLVQVLAPEEGLPFDDVNDASVALRVTYGKTTFLFTGDAEADAERRMVARYGALLQSDVVKVGHHGSRTSSTRAFVDRVAADASRPLWAVVSVGPQVRFGLPDEEVLARWRTQGADVWTTAQRGALWLRSDGHRIRRVAWR